MALPSLYKYLDVKGAKLTLSNGTFKHSRPSDFNDIEDLTVQSIFPEEIENALKKISDNFTDVILQHVNDPPTCSSPMKEKLALIQHVYRTNAKAAEIVKEELRKGSDPAYDAEYMRNRANWYIKEINDFLQDFRVLCVTTHKDSEKMWAAYAEDHTGIVLRIEATVQKDSKFQLFRPVHYRERRPSLYDDTLDFVVGSLFGDHEARLKAIVDKLVYSKTLAWKHEGEYRLAIWLRKDEPAWNTLAFHPEEITELYLGCAIKSEDKEFIVATAKVLNPNIAIFQAIRDRHSILIYNRI